ncbi:MAG TPA: hypothetical protein ACQGQI_05470, partial [Xylella sp.]
MPLVCTCFARARAHRVTPLTVSTSTSTNSPEALKVYQTSGLIAATAAAPLESRTATPLDNFLQRWFGYCTTGSVQEQAFAVHYGQGRNGKSTLLDLISGVLGSY